jgi:valyl-tRNA synthetase
MDKYELGIAVSKLYDFFWEEFCDWYIEMVKPRLYNKEDNTRKAALWTLKTVLINALKLLHPYMPFITEEIFTNIQNEEETIMLSAWPEFKEEWKFSVEEDEIELMKQAIRNIRNLRAEMNVPPSKKAKPIVVSEDDKVLDIFERGKVFFASLAYGNEVLVQKDKTGVDEDAVSTIIPGATIYIPFAELVDISKEIERLQKEKEKLIKEVERVEKKLSNKGFVEKAPQNVIEEEKEKQVKYKTMLEQVEERLKALSKK